MRIYFCGCGLVNESGSLTCRTCLNCSSKLQLLFWGGELAESRGGGEFASLFDDEPGGVKDDPDDNPLDDRFWGISPRPPVKPPLVTNPGTELDDNWGGIENDVLDGVWIPKRPWMYSGSWI